ncbi:phosphoribosyltransferase family protein [Sphingomonas sp. SRS2]|uniref:phosphoribosyltransferase family protein n=1 Tax=Sphingomonas sp. SRS2 TaxID=133190 RepID=UPI0006184204|nr:phosphoribosyltransferase family protein [Sphingomonas sp. SRS2]KKC27758.1 phosphoribosyltransferase [Sphingomonas sp. SRS2]
MEYRSFADLAASITRNSYRLPADVDLIVGIPRSGMLAANMMATHLNLPFVDLESYLAGLRPFVGRTVRDTMRVDGSETPGRVLVVDDSILSGTSMAEVRSRIEAERPGADVTYCAVYAVQEEHPEIDVWLELVQHPRIFQWNLMRHNRLADSCFDIDGVLCHDPADEDNDDGERYQQFLLNARPLLQPGVRIKHLVTSRLEKYRAETEKWLRTHAVDYENLWMLDGVTAEERRRLKLHAIHKAKVYRRTNACLFVESDDRQAVEIAELSGRPVLSVEGQRITWPTSRTDAARTRFQREKGNGQPAGQGLRQGIIQLIRRSPAGAAFVERWRSLRV